MVQELTRFYERLLEDPRLGHTHICMYMALFQRWNIEGFQNPVIIRRLQIMRTAKINSKATYAKCLRELTAYGYIRYVPCNHPAMGSQVFLLPLGKPKELHDS